jgi:hypothetical protein
MIRIEVWTLECEADFLTNIVSVTELYTSRYLREPAENIVEIHDLAVYLSLY